MVTSQLQNQIALVTGASSEIGSAVAISLAAAGAKVEVNYARSAKGTEAVVAEIQAAGGETIPLQVDVSQEDQVLNMFQQLYDAYGTIDILVNNAGLQKDAAFVEMTIEQWNKVMAVNLTGQFLCVTEAAKEFLHQGVIPEKSCSAGKVICMSSVHEVIPCAGHCNYAASKGGVMPLMQSMAQELAPRKIRMNSTGPGAIKTPKQAGQA